MKEVLASYSTEGNVNFLFHRGKVLVSNSPEGKYWLAIPQGESAGFLFHRGGSASFIYQIEASPVSDCTGGSASQLGDYDMGGGRDVSGLVGVCWEVCF